MSDISIIKKKLDSPLPIHITEEEWVGLTKVMYTKMQQLMFADVFICDDETNMNDPQRKIMQELYRCNENSNMFYKVLNEFNEKTQYMIDYCKTTMEKEIRKLFLDKENKLLEKIVELEKDNAFWYCRETTNLKKLVEKNDS